MKALFLLIILLTLSFTSLSAQSENALTRQCATTTSKRPLVFVGNIRTDINSLVIDPNNIDSINVLKDSNVTAKFGTNAKNGVIIIYPKQHVSLLKINNILDNYNIPNQDKTLRVCINKNVVEERDLILIESTEIENVEITKDRHWTKVEEANSGEKFINIITRTKDKNGL